MQLTDEILLAFINCPYKGYLKSNGQKGFETEYQILFNQLKKTQTDTITKSIKELTNYEGDNKTFEKLISKNAIYTNLQFKTDKLNIAIDVVEFIENKKIIPTLILPLEKVTKADKLYLAIKATLVQNECNLQTESCKIIFGKSQKQTRFKLSSFIKIIKKSLIDLNRVLSNPTPPVFYKNVHCQVCEYQNSCLEKLRERDDLSLLAGMKVKEIQQKNNRGIFSVKQLSFTFRPKKNIFRKRKFMPELKAYAIKENKTFIQELPVFKQVNNELFLDFEGLTDRAFNYLIGLIIRSNNEERIYSFWANNDHDETKIFIDLLDLIEKIDDYVIYHYGSYEIQVLKRISKKLPEKYQGIIKTAISNSFNFLNIFTQNVYPPTYTNSLKDIARYLSFNWTEQDASGLQSVVWRYKWESTGNHDFKNRLITYNIEDCKALMIVKDWVASIPKNINENCKKVEEIKIDSIKKWGKANFLIKELTNINNFASFNYQRNKVYIKTYPEIRKQEQTINRKKSSKKIKPNKVIEAECPIICRNCNGNKFLKHDKQKRIVIDLKITKTGIKRQIILYHNDRFQCVNCKCIRNPENHIKIHSKYGWNLQCWIINQIVQYRISFKKVVLLLKETFDIDFSKISCLIRKNFALLYVSTYNELLDRIRNSSLIHVDETIFHIGREVAYVWVFTNINTVYYLFRPTREAEFLEQLLYDFKGVLISDFYAGYDSLDCPKQKCLIHLIRDLNDDLVKNQLNNEYLVMVNNFSKLLNEIILTVNRFGLKKRYLKKHFKEVNLFFKRLKEIEFETEICEKWKKRFLSYQNELFTFMNYDGVPWNNNNAEAAIKAVALYRRDVDGLPTPKAIQEYLVLLSIQQTCKYRGISYFNFLRSRETSLSEFSKKKITL